jgi:uncharacterized protein
MVTDFHHFKGQGLSRSEKVQRKIIELIQKMDGKTSESSVVWELKHSSGCIQIGRILALKRNLNVELAEIICALHDIYAIVKGTYKEHAKLGALMAKELLKKTKEFDEKEIEIIVDAIAKHSQKEIDSDDFYAELIKDVDAYDCSLYQGSENYYKLHKTNVQYGSYVKRIKKVQNELGLKTNQVFRK